MEGLDDVELKDPLGEGGMATVYRAHDRRLDRPVAVKLMRPELAASPEYRKRFAREARALAACAHPNVLALYASSPPEAPRLYLVTELVEGPTLADLGPVPWPVAVALTERCLAGLAAAHAREILHRDLKPSNILLTKEGAPKLADFGLARAAGQTSITAGGPAGTVRYMAPEVLDGGADAPAQDVYAMGLVLQELLTGHPAFDAEAVQDLVLRVTAGDRAPLPAHVPSPVRELVEKAAARDFAARFASAEAMRAACAAILDAEQVSDAEALIARWLASDRAAPAAMPAMHDVAAGSDEPTRPIPVPTPSRVPPPGRPITADEGTTRVVAPPCAATPAPAGTNVFRYIVMYGSVACAIAGLWIAVLHGPRVPPGLTPVEPDAAGVARWRSEPDGAWMVRVPAGPFTMGSGDGEPNERPPRVVTLPEYFIDATEVTNAQFARFVAATRHQTVAERAGWALVDLGGDDSQKTVGATWRAPLGPGSTAGDDLPVVNVSWDDAAAFAKWAGKRLPLEAEWEKAARGGLEGRRYPWGDEGPDGRAVFGAASKPARVASFPANALGLHDMAGNVWEWCADPYEAGGGRVARSNAYDADAADIRCAYRNTFPPRGAYSYVGFRCVR